MKHRTALLTTIAVLALTLPAFTLTQPARTLAEPSAPSGPVTTVLERRILADDPPPGAQLYQAVLDFEPGAWTPVHSHTGASYNTVLAGAVTLRQDGVEQTFTAGQGWVDAPGVIHAAGNQSGANARLIASFVVRPGLAPSTIIPPAPGAVVPPPPTTVAFFKLSSAELPPSLAVVHQLVTLEPGATLPGLTTPGARIVSVLDGSLLTDQAGQFEAATTGDSWAELPDPPVNAIAGEAGAQIVLTTFIAPGASCRSSCWSADHEHDDA
jgi:quercetin dioxygenase-like cupin family protein